MLSLSHSHFSSWWCDSIDDSTLINVFYMMVGLMCPLSLRYPLPIFFFLFSFTPFSFFIVSTAHSSLLQIDTLNRLYLHYGVFGGVNSVVKIVTKQICTSTLILICRNMLLNISVCMYIKTFKHFVVAVLDLSLLVHNNNNNNNRHLEWTEGKKIYSFRIIIEYGIMSHAYRREKKGAIWR